MNRRELLKRSLFAGAALPFTRGKAPCDEVIAPAEFPQRTITPAQTGRRVVIDGQGIQFKPKGTACVGDLKPFDGKLYCCTASGTPGEWAKVGMDVTV